MLDDGFENKITENIGRTKREELTVYHFARTGNQNRLEQRLTFRLET